MRRPQVVVFESSSRLARLLEPIMADKKWVLRESRQVDACLRLVTGLGPTVLCVHTPTKADASWNLLATVTASQPSTRTIAVGDDDAWARLAWDLGADFALFPPTPLTNLPAIVAGLMDVT